MAGIDGSMAHLSDTFFTTAIAVYSVAMVGFTAEYAFGRRGRVAAAPPVPIKAAASAGKPAVPAAKAAERELVAAGSGGSAGGLEVDVDESITTTVSIAKPATATKAAAAAKPATGSGGGRPPTTRTSGVVETSSERGSLADRIGRFSLAIVVLGLVAHATSIAIRGIAVDAVPWSNMYEFASVAGLVGVIAFLALMWKAPQIRHLGGFILLPVIVIMFLAGTVFYSQAQPLVPALQSYWLAIHVTLAATSEGALMTSSMLTILYLVKRRYDRRADTPGGTRGALDGLAAKLPATATLDKVAYRIVAFAFPLYTVGIICGAIWAEAAWGRYWGWDPKETWAFIVWVVYACYLHARATAGWRGRAAAWINLLGFGAITFNFFVVNLVVTGLHSYAGVG